MDKITIYQMLSNMGMNQSLAGFRYCADAISLCVKDQSILDGITKTLYPSVAVKNDKKPNNIERGIRHAIEKLYSETEPEQINQYTYINCNPKKGKPENSRFIAALVYYILDHRDAVEVLLE